MMELIHVPAAMVGKAWREGASDLAQACEKSQGEITADQLKAILLRGERSLLCILDHGKPAGWIVAQVQVSPNMRVLYLYQMVAPNMVGPELLDRLREMAQRDGCERIEAACHEEVAQAWARKVGAKPLYTVMGIDVWA